MIILGKIALGVVLANFYDWAIHKYILHEIGKNKQSFWNFHWGEHHRACRKDKNRDGKVYFKEIFALSLLLIVHTPVYFLSPVVFAVMIVYAVSYYGVHRYSHANTSWGKKYLPWHWDHHMGKNQDANWCVLFPLSDYVFGTRKKSNGR